MDLSIKILRPITSSVLCGFRPLGVRPIDGLSIKQRMDTAWAFGHWLSSLSIKALPFYWLSAAVRHSRAPRPLAELSLHHDPYCWPQLPINLYPSADWSLLHHLTTYWPARCEAEPRLVQTPSGGGRSRAVPDGGRWRRERVGAAAAPGRSVRGERGRGAAAPGPAGRGATCGLLQPPSHSSRRAGGASGSGARSGAGPAFRTRLPRERPGGSRAVRPGGPRGSSAHPGPGVPGCEAGGSRGDLGGSPGAAGSGWARGSPHGGAL